MSNLSLICLVGYAWACMVILGLMGTIESPIANVAAMAGGGAIGYWCAHCDMKERL